MNVKEPSIQPSSIHENILKDVIDLNAFVESYDFIAVHEHIGIGLLQLNLAQSDTNIEESGILNKDVNSKANHLNFYFIPDRATEKNKAINILTLHIHKSFITLFPKHILDKNRLLSSQDGLLQKFTLNNEIRDKVEDLSKIFMRISLQFEDLLEFFNLTSTTLYKILRVLTLPDETNSYPACSFLNNVVEREKIQLARSIIKNNLSTPLTIRELARQCGINECYLKKGFKAMFGRTIHEYREIKRIERSKEIIMQGNCNINEVAAEMGYTSHAYFSTAFKKHTGIKPCDLLAMAQ